MKVLVLGASGMAGHTVALYLNESGADVTALTRRPFELCNNIVGDATNLHFLENVIKEGKFDAIVNCIGILNKDAEENKANAVFLNSFLPHFLVFITQNTATKIIHMSTDCVFSGYNAPYKENSFHDGETFYDRSKALGEINDTKNLTFRNSIIGPDISDDGCGLFNWFMKQDNEIHGFHNAIWTGVTTITLAKAIKKAIENNLTGLYNLVNNTSISKYELCVMFNDYFKEGKIEIVKDFRDMPNKTLINTRKDFDFIVPTYRQMIIEMKEWILEHKNLYPQYNAARQEEK
ncbi:MAG: sugar nucleotide-binding protein [Clostridia bacterium]